MALVTISLEGLARSVGQSMSLLHGLLTEENVEGFFARLGVVFPRGAIRNGPVRDVVLAAGTAAGAVADAATELSGAGNDLITIAVLTTKVTNAISESMTAFAALEKGLRDHAGDLGLPPAEVQAFAAELQLRVFDYAVVRRLESWQRQLAAVLSGFGVIDLMRIELDDPGVSGVSYVQRRLRLELLSLLLSDPPEFVRRQFGFGAASFGDLTAAANASGLDLIRRLRGLFLGLGYEATLTFVGPGKLPGIEFGFGNFRVDGIGTSASLVLELKRSLSDGFSVAVPIASGWQAFARVQGDWAPGTEIRLIAPDRIEVAPVSGEFSGRLSVGLTYGGATLGLIGQSGSTRLEVENLSLELLLDLEWDASVMNAVGHPSIQLSATPLRAVVNLGSGDGFLSSLTGGQPREAEFDLRLQYSLSEGLSFGASGLTFDVPLNVSLGPVGFRELRISIPLDAASSGIPLSLRTTLDAKFGPFQAVVEGFGLGLEFDLDGSGAIGFGDVSAKPLLPTGVGLSIDAGSIRGGGYLSLDPDAGRYAGVAELQVFTVAVKAFGILDTRLPGGEEGYSLVVVISAEFPPIQLGFGFTLNGVGGLLGVHRTLATEALSSAVRDGRLDHLLFPSDPVRQAPALIHDLGTVFPAAKDNFVLGPMAKLGWGTPTLIEGKLGIILQFPGPRIAVLGDVRAALPSREARLIQLNMSVGGLLDFPGSLFAIDAVLYDSKVGGYVLSGGMATRLKWGSHPNFAFSVGGLNPSYQPPPGFPKLPRLSIDLGVRGNPSLTAQGYFALTSNTAQAGAAIDLRASGAGVTLQGHLGFDALIVFSPFSFTAAIEAGVSVRFHGVGFGIHLRGELSGPSPWRIQGKVCVSVLFWDACLRIDHKFGQSKKAELPSLDPWEGDPGQGIIGLRAALEDRSNWYGSLPGQSERVVSLRESPEPLIDPLGAASVRQRVVPLNREIEKFGEHAAAGVGRYELLSVAMGERDDDGDGEPEGIHVFDKAALTPVMELFAPAQFSQLDDAQRLSGESFEPMEAGTSLTTAEPRVGATRDKDVVYETEVLYEAPATAPSPYALLASVLVRLLGRSASALNGGRRNGSAKYLPLGNAPQIALTPELFVVVRRDSLAIQVDVSIGAAAQARSTMQQLLVSETRSQPSLAALLQVIPLSEAAGV